MSSQKQKRELQPEQAAAVYEIKKHISVTAGPGSGKTTVLVARYLHILSRNPNLNIDQIVAITFTNRAANEMRERLREELNLILQTTKPAERKHWLNYKRTLDGAVITTIHGFCARLLREFPVEAHIDPQFILLDEHRAAMLLESVVEETLNEFIRSGHIEISRLTLGVGRGKLADTLAQLYRDVRGRGLSFEDLALRTAQSHATEEDHAAAVAELCGAINDFLAVRRTTPAGRANQSKALASWSALQAAVSSVPEVEAIADYCRNIESFRKVRPSAVGAVKDHVATLDALVWKTDLAGRVPQVALDMFASQYALEMSLLLNRIDERLTEEKQKISGLDFDDLELRALELLKRPEVMTRAAERYKFFLVDEFQDTNGLQRTLLERLALRSRGESANLFIVGDPKQSIYGFRGADVAVFKEMTSTLEAAGGESRPLPLNFRSQPPLISFFNYLFERLFKNHEEVAPEELPQLGYVAHEPSEARRDLRDNGPLVELMVTTEASGSEDDPKAEQNSRELDAEQLARRIISLVDPGSASPEGAVGSPAVAESAAEGRQEIPAPRYSDIALLFRAMTQVHTYESAFRRANIPYQTVLGRGFYEREEITDLIQLLRFLDNKTDELALAAVLRSPLCGISDNALLALRCGPTLAEIDDPDADTLKHFTQVRKLYYALRTHRDVAFISEDEHVLLDRASNVIKGLIARQHHYSLSSLLRFAVERSEFEAVIAASFDGAQKLANVQRLFILAERFERTGHHLIRDFVRYVEEFEAIGSRESEGQIDEATNAVKLMTIHQAKGLEFPIVIIPDLQRWSKPPESWVLLDRQGGLTMKVPDGRGKLVAGLTFNRFEQRHARREQFESMRLLYVAATRAQDRLILSGTTKELEKLGVSSGTWLNWIWQSLELTPPSRSGLVTLAPGVELQLTLNIAEKQEDSRLTAVREAAPAEQPSEPGESIAQAFPLVSRIEPHLEGVMHRFSVTQLINYQRCPRQYYFERILHAPAPDAIAVWNDAEAPEPPANLTATLKGAVIHKFCETYARKDDAEQLLRKSFADVVRVRQSELADRLVELDVEKAIVDLMPLAQNYLSSGVFERVERARAVSSQADTGPINPSGDKPGLWSELGFRLRRPHGILTGAIDKLLVTPSVDGKSLEIEIVDFKTNRIRAGKPVQEISVDQTDDRFASLAGDHSSRRTRGRHVTSAHNQIAFDFTSQQIPEVVTMEPTVDDQVSATASDYQLQMQAYALAVNELMPSLVNKGAIMVTLHFLDPNIEFKLVGDVLSRETCMSAIDNAMMDIIHSTEPSQFPVRPAMHCRMCSFLGICPAGKDWVSSDRLARRNSEFRKVAEASR